MIVPRRSPCHCIGVDLVEEKVVKEPDVGVAINVKPVMSFQNFKEIFPFASETLCDIYPETLNAYVVYAPKLYVI
jgi:hypothetical protein